MKSKFYLKLSTICLFFTLSCSSDDSGNSREDLENPSITLTVTKPYIIQPETTKIIANVSDDIGISKVEFYDEFQNLRLTDLEEPYELDLSYGPNAYGKEKFFAIVYDLSDNLSVSEETEIRINVEREIPALQISLYKNSFSTTDNTIVPLPTLIGAPGKSGTIYFTKHTGSDCNTPFTYYTSHPFTDGNVENLSYQFNNGSTGNFSFSARVVIPGMPEIVSNCVNFSVY